MKIHSKIKRWQRGSGRSKHSKQRPGSTLLDLCEKEIGSVSRVRMAWQIIAAIIDIIQKGISNSEATHSGMISETSTANVSPAINTKKYGKGILQTLNKLWLTAKKWERHEIQEIIDRYESPPNI